MVIQVLTHHDGLQVSVFAFPKAIALIMAQTGSKRIAMTCNEIDLVYTTFYYYDIRLGRVSSYKKLFP